LTSNKGSADWGEVFNDQVLATAIVDCPLHHATTVITVPPPSPQASRSGEPLPRGLSFNRPGHVIGRYCVATWPDRAAGAQSGVAPVRRR
jgi:hypothetical protein